MLSRALLTLFLLMAADPAMGSNYDVMVVRDKPVLYVAGPAHPLAKVFPRGTALKKTRMPNGDTAPVFDGRTQYLEFASEKAYSVRKRGALTLEAWIRPDTLEFPGDESDGYVHWAGKGESGEHEYVCRMYSKTNSANRPNRISAYAFNPDGGLGSGAYFQDSIQPRQWLHVAMVIDTRPKSGNGDTGTISIYRDGVLRKKVLLSQFDVIPAPGNAPLRLGTRDMRSFFKGAIGKFALYQRPLSQGELSAHVRAMMPK